MATKEQRAKLRTLLSRFTESTVPDNYFEAWKVLFHRSPYKNRDQIIEQAIKDMEEDEGEALIRRFDSFRPTLEDKTKEKWNW